METFPTLQVDSKRLARASDLDSTSNNLKCLAMTLPTLQKLRPDTEKLLEETKETTKTESSLDSSTDKDLPGLLAVGEASRGLVPVSCGVVIQNNPI